MKNIKILIPLAFCSLLMFCHSSEKAKVSNTLIKNEITQSDTKKIIELAQKAYEAFKSKDKAIVFNFMYNNSIIIGRPDEKSFKDSYARYKNYYTKRKQSSFEKKCNNYTNVWATLIKAKPEIKKMPELNEQLIKVFSTYYYLEEPQNTNERAKSLQQQAVLNGEKGAKMKFIKANNKWKIYRI